MTALVTVDDLGDFLRPYGEALDPAGALLAVSLASGLVRAYTRQQLDVVTNESVSLEVSENDHPFLGQPWHCPPWRYVRDLYLPERPVTAVSSVSQNGEVVDPSGYSWTPYGRLRSTTAWIPGAQVVVVYSHGYSPLPDAIDAVTLSVAARLYSNPEDLKAESVGGDYTASFGKDPSAMLNAAEQAALSPYCATPVVG